MAEGLDELSKLLAEANEVQKEVHDSLEMFSSGASARHPLGMPMGTLRLVRNAKIDARVVTAGEEAMLEDSALLAIQVERARKFKLAWLFWQGITRRCQEAVETRKSDPPAGVAPGIELS